MDDFARSIGVGDHITADALASMRRRDLEALYAEASVPDSLEELDGDPRGIVLAVPGLDREPLASALRRVASWENLPWQGKSFLSHGDERGEGVNRFRLLGELASFSTSLDRSTVDGLPCVVLDYDRPENPWPLRAVRDELREVAPGLCFGPATIQVGGRRLTFLYFAVDYGAG